MKKIIAALAAIMMFVPAFSLAEEAAPAAADEPAAMAEAEAVEDEVGDELNAEAEEGGWYELSEDGTVLTVRLPMMNSEDGYEWSFEAEDGSPLELLTNETTTDEDGDPMWVGSFRSTATADAAAVLTFKYAKGDNFPALQCLLLTSLTADSKIAVESANVEDYTWLEVDDEDGKTLYIGLEANETTGYSWSWITDRDGALNMVLDTYISDDDGDDEVVREAAKQEVIRRYCRICQDYKTGAADEGTLARINVIMQQMGLTTAMRRVVQPALDKAKASGHPAVAIELDDGRIITGRGSDMMSAAAGCMLNAIKALAGIDDAMRLLSPIVLEPISKMKRMMGAHDVSLSLEDVLMALSICAATNPIVETAFNCIPKLRGCDAHSSIILPHADESVLRKLGINITCEAEFPSKDLYFE